jgi:hypothetical protein
MSSSVTLADSVLITKRSPPASTVEPDGTAIAGLTRHDAA